MFATAWLWLLEWAASKTKVFWIDLGVLSLTFFLGGCAGCACEKHRPHWLFKESAEPPLAVPLTFGSAAVCVSCEPKGEFYGAWVYDFKDTLPTGQTLRLFGGTREENPGLVVGHRYRLEVQPVDLDAQSPEPPPAK